MWQKNSRYANFSDLSTPSYAIFDFVKNSATLAASHYFKHYSAAASGWAGWALAHPEFGSSVNPITTRGADYAHHITASPPGFENPAAALERV